MHHRSELKGNLLQTYCRPIVYYFEEEIANFLIVYSSTPSWVQKREKKCQNLLDLQNLDFRAHCHYLLSPLIREMVQNILGPIVESDTTELVRYDYMCPC